MFCANVCLKMYETVRGSWGCKCRVGAGTTAVVLADQQEQLVAAPQTEQPLLVAEAGVLVTRPLPFCERERAQAPVAVVGGTARGGIFSCMDTNAEATGMDD